MAEIVGAVAGVIAAFAACDIFVKKIQDIRKRKKRLQLQQRILAAEVEFHKSAVKGKRKIEEKYWHGIETIGKIFATGDEISNSELLKVTLDMTHNLVNIVGFLLGEKKDILSVTEYARLKIFSDHGRVATVDALRGLFQRKSQAAPVRPELKLNSGKESKNGDKNGREKSPKPQRIPSVEHTTLPTVTAPTADSEIEIIEPALEKSIVALAAVRSTENAVAQGPPSSRYAALVNAVRSGDMTKAKDLAKSTSDIKLNIADVLEIAIKRRDMRIITLLMDSGADMEAVNKHGLKALHVATLFGRDEALRLLLERGADIEGECRMGGKALHYAAQDGRAELVRLLLDRGADIEAKTHSGRKPLHYAVVKGHDMVAGLLLDRGANIEATDNDQWRPLHVAAGHGNDEVARLLLDRGADVKARGSGGWKALHYAAGIEKEELVRLLLDKGADIEAQGDNGGRALHVAAYHGRYEVARLLVERGAKIEARDEYGRSALQVGEQVGRGRVVQLLRDAARIEFRRSLQWIQGDSIPLSRGRRVL